MPAAPRETCPACHALGCRAVLGVPSIPIHSCVLLPSAAAARAFPRGDLELRYCPSCDFLFNAAFEPDRMDYREDYEETQGCSPTFRAWMEALVGELVQRLDLAGAPVVEIGCGRGDFLEALCRASGGSGTGVDPSATAGRVDRAAGGGLTFLREEYGARHAALPAKLVACRHTLEHLADVHGFLAQVRANLEGRDAWLFVEVPDVERQLVEGAFWDFYYEHASYFSRSSLRRALERAGFEVAEVRRSYGEQYLQAFARPSGVPGAASDGPTAGFGALVDAFRERVARSRSAWESRLARAARAGERVVLWGSGSKATAFLTTIAGADAVLAVVDLNPQKNAKFVAGTGHEIIAPERLPALRPDLVVIMNPVYRQEITRDLERLGVRAEVLALGADEP